MSLQELLQKVCEEWPTAKLEPFTQHSMGPLFTQSLGNSIGKIASSINTSYVVEASRGKGNWANVPWIAVFDPNITQSAQKGIYPVYLFRPDGTGVYLSLGFGATELQENCTLAEAKEKALKIRERLTANIPGLSKWDLEISLDATTATGKSYEWATAGAKFYESNNIPSDEILTQDLKDLLHIYSQVPNFKMDFQQAEASNTSVDKLKTNGIVIRISKPFLLLAGISGTGKTRFIRDQASATGSLSETYCLTSVRPDWHEPSDLLGYVSRLSGTAEFVSTDVLRFIVKAWKSAVDAGLSVSFLDNSGKGSALTVTGGQSLLDNVMPYWLCLDEMNLAPVEQYFADYLSVLETRHWHWESDEFTYTCDPLLKPFTISQIADQNKLRADLNISESAYDHLWDLFCQYGIGIPLNLIVAGTVNMDETTHGFSRKVIDRALTFDFGEFFPNRFDEYFKPNTKIKSLSYPIWSQADLTQLPAIDSGGKKSIAFLSAVNEVLEGTPFRLAFRALNELLLSVISTSPTDDLTLKAVWDDFMMCKVLPRIDGDRDKLAAKESGQSLLQALSRTLETGLSDFWHEGEGSAKARPDLYRESTGAEQVIRIPCRSKQKIAWMQQRLEKSEFTSFWP